MVVDVAKSSSDLTVYIIFDYFIDVETIDQIGQGTIDREIRIREELEIEINRIANFNAVDIITYG
jgi:hypothetical protein